MNQNRETLHSTGDGEQKTKMIDSQSKVKSSWPKKLTLPSIQSTVIQEPPSVQQAPPSLQPAEKLNLPKIQSKERKAPAKPRSAAKRILPSIPTVGELSLPSIQANASTSMTHNLSILPATEEKAQPSSPNPQVKEPLTVESAVGRILPNIPSQEDLDLSSIEPTAVRPNIRSRSRRRLPIPPTITEKTSPMRSKESAKEEGVHSAINNISQSLEAKEKDSSLPSAPSVVEQAQTSLQSVKKDVLLPGTEELQPKKKASKNGSKRARKLLKGTQTVLQFTEEEVMPSHGENMEKVPEIPGKTVEYPLQKTLTATSSKENQPNQSDTLSIVQAERDPEQPVNEAVSGSKPSVTESSPNPQPTFEQALPRPPITRRTRKARPESVPPLNLDQLCPKSPPRRRMKSSSKTTNVELLGNDQGAARQSQKNTKAKRLVPPVNLNQKRSKPPGASQIKFSSKATDVADEAARQIQTKADPKQLVPPLNSEQTKPPADRRRIKISTQVTQTSEKPPTKVQRAAKQTQAKAEGLFSPKQTLEHKIPKPPAARRTKLSSETTRGALGSSKGTISQTKAETLLRPPATKPSNVSPQATEGGPLKSVPGTLPNTLTKRESLSNPQHTLDHNLPRPETARPTKADLTVTDTQEVPSLLSQNIEAPPNQKPKPETFLNDERRESEALQRLQLIAKQCRSNGQPLGRYSHSHLIAKSFLPGIQSTKEEATLLKPHPPAANFTKKGQQRTPLTVKQPRPNVRASFDRELTNQQPTAKRGLTSNSSSNLHTLVKQPLPSIERDEESNVQPTVKETERSSQSGHLPGLERQ